MEMMRGRRKIYLVSVLVVGLMSPLVATSPASASDTVDALPPVSYDVLDLDVSSLLNVYDADLQNAEALSCDFPYQQLDDCIMVEVSEGRYRVASTYFEDPTAHGGAQEDVDRAIYLTGLSAPVTAYTAIVIAARNSLGIPNTAVNLTYDQDMALSAAMDSIALNLAQSLTQPAISSLAGSTDTTEQLVFQTLGKMAADGWNPVAASGGGGYSGLNDQEKRVCKKAVRLLPGAEHASVLLRMV